MMQQPAGIRFRETMAGGMTLGVEDYREGERLGREAGNILAMHATITIDDMERFIAEPQHEALLQATVDYPPLGNAIPCRDGHFNLFSPGNVPQMKLMVYEFGFSHEGRDYFLSGHKEIRDDPGFDMWSDTTTLYTRIHHGSDCRGEVAASGILSLGIGDLLNLVASMETLHAEGLGERAATLGRFGRFFMGELWDTYAGKIG